MKKFLIILVLIVTCFILFSQNTDTVIVEDSDNVYLGRLLGYTSGLIAVLTDGGYYYCINVETGEIAEISMLYYDNTDCSGVGYIPGVFGFPHSRAAYIYRYDEDYYLRKSDPSSDHTRSQYLFNQDRCQVHDETIDLYYYEEIPTVYKNFLNAIVPPLNLY